MKRSLKKLSALLLLMGLFVLTGCAAKETLPNEEVYQGCLLYTSPAVSIR